MPFTEPGPNFLVNKYTVQPATFISWPTDAPVADVVAFFEGNNEAVQYGPGEERELRSAISAASKDISQTPIPRAASVQDADLITPSNVARIHVGDLFLLEKKLAAEAPLDANIWITCCSGRAQIGRINCSISGPTSTTLAPITHGKGERRICPCHPPSPVCARFAGNHTVEAYIRHPWPLEFSKMCASCDMQVSVGKNSE
jgi:hypothetical protein